MSTTLADFLRGESQHFLPAFTLSLKWCQLSLGRRPPDTRSGNGGSWPITEILRALGMPPLATQGSP
jgi:hypothetical protein